jgi:hypothetical protein
MHADVDDLCSTRLVEENERRPRRTVAFVHVEFHQDREVAEIQYVWLYPCRAVEEAYERTRKHRHVFTLSRRQSTFVSSC